MNSNILYINKEQKIGTSYLAKGFNRDHKHVLESIGKHKEAYLSFGDLESRRMATMGRPAKEFMLNKSQVMLLLSIMRTTSQIVKFRIAIIKLFTDEEDSFKTIKSMIDNFDFESVNGMYVYAARDCQGRIKIGISRDPEKRIKNLNIGNADKLELIYTKQSDGNGYRSETIMHKKASQYRIHGEWFEKEAVELLN